MIDSDNEADEAEKSCPACPSEASDESAAQPTKCGEMGAFMCVLTKWGNGGVCVCGLNVGGYSLFCKQFSLLHFRFQQSNNISIIIEDFYTRLFLFLLAILTPKAASPPTAGLFSRETSCAISQGTLRGCDKGFTSVRKVPVQYR